MPNIYELYDNAENKIQVAPEIYDSVRIGNEEVFGEICGLIQRHCAKEGRPCRMAFDGNYAVNWKEILSAMRQSADAAGIDLTCVSVSGLFRPYEEIQEYRKPFTQWDPSLGWENRDGRMQQIMDMDKVKGTCRELQSKNTCERAAAYVIYGPGAGIAEMREAFDCTFYFEMPKSPIMWALWGGNLIPMGRESPDPSYSWKDLYYVDFNLLDNQKWDVFERMDYFVDAANADRLTLIPRRAYDAIITTLLRYPIKQIRTFMPGPFGAYRFKDLWNVPGLDNSAWNSIASPKLDILIDIGGGKQLRLPSVNLLQYGNRLVGDYWDREVPKWWPLLAAIDDGYFPDPDTPLERTAMCQHNHPSTEYVRRNFNEQFGRYETYYILEAYENSATIMGFKEHADLEEWERKCWAAAENKELIPDWKDYVNIWSTAAGDLFLIPPGTTHGHGGRQMVLELDTNVNTTTCEYSFYMHDYGRNSWDEETKTMTGKKCNLQCRHGFAVDKFRRENWVRENLRARPVVKKWTKEYCFEQYTTLPEMPFHIERFHFVHRAEYDTEGRFMHVATLAEGQNVTIRSIEHPEYSTTIDHLQAAIIPAYFGKYEMINNGEGLCTLVYIHMKQ